MYITVRVINGITRN